MRKRLLVGLLSGLLALGAVACDPEFEGDPLEGDGFEDDAFEDDAFDDDAMDDG